MKLNLLFQESLEADVQKAVAHLKDISEQLAKTDIEIRDFWRKCLESVPKLYMISKNNENYVGILETKLSIVGTLSHAH